mgnify:CR=1 FL=1
MGRVFERELHKKEITDITKIIKYNNFKGLLVKIKVIH